MEHITVLKKEAVDLLGLEPTSVVIDATYGAGGHAGEICSRLSNLGTYIGLDIDETALMSAPEKVQSNGPRCHFVNSNFSEIVEVARSLQIKQVKAILADLGWRSEQFTAGKKGFSFMNDEPLIMTYGKPEDYPFTAYDIVNGWKEEDIANVIYGYGEERAARRIARALVEKRKENPITTSKMLADIIVSVLPRNQHKRIHPATRTFQALRIAVNDELGILERFIPDALSLLAPGGVLAIITFHSLEDRIVKLTFRELASTGQFEIITRRPITPTSETLSVNPRARSAKLRGIRKII